MRFYSIGSLFETGRKLVGKPACSGLLRKDKSLCPDGFVSSLWVGNGKDFQLGCGGDEVLLGGSPHYSISTFTKANGAGVKGRGRE